MTIEFNQGYMEHIMRARMFGPPDFEIGIKHNLQMILLGWRYCKESPVDLKIHTKVTTRGWGRSSSEIEPGLVIPQGAKINMEWGPLGDEGNDKYEFKWDKMPTPEQGIAKPIVFYLHPAYDIEAELIEPNQNQKMN